MIKPPNHKRKIFTLKFGSFQTNFFFQSIKKIFDKIGAPADAGFSRVESAAPKEDIKNLYGLFPRNHFPTVLSVEYGAKAARQGHYSSTDNTIGEQSLREEAIIFFVYNTW